MKVLIAGSGEGYQNYLKACISVGIDADLMLKDYEFDSYSGLIMPGGVDINPALYNESNTCSMDIDDELDKYQLEILDRFVQSGKPVFGTCRGCQLLNVYFGGSLIQDIKGHSIENDGLHPVHILERNLFFDIYGNDLLVNSTHHQCVENIGKGLSVAAVSDDGITEAIVHKSLPVFAVQWHPEKIMNLGGEKLYLYFKSIL